MSEELNKPPPPKAPDRSASPDEFFSVGVPLHAVRPGYILRKADDDLFDAALNGRYAHILAPDRSGKTSLIAATAARLEAADRKIAILDLAQIGLRDGGSDPGRWYYSVAYRLLRQLRIRYDLQGWWHDRSMLSNRQRLLEFYSEILLHFVSERIVIFVDELQCIEGVPSAEQLLASIRAAHNARTTDPDFSRLTFVLLGECDPVSLIDEPELSPFNITQQVALDDFSREQLDLFATELNLSNDDARRALDRIYYWTRGQPYLTQKLARQVARDADQDDLIEYVDWVAGTQLAGRAALHSEPHMGHIHRFVVGDKNDSEAMLNLYGRMRKGIEVGADLGSAAQRRLLAVGLVEIDHDGILQVRNRLYKTVFTSRWANENLPMRLRVPVTVLGAFLMLVLAPFWYTQLLPRSYMEILTSPTVELDAGLSAYENLRSFPGHSDTADNLFREFVKQRAELATEYEEVAAVAEIARELPEHGRLPETLTATFWDGRARAARREERRDAALLATLEALVEATPYRRQRAASLVSDDYPLLLATLPPQPAATSVFDPANLLLTAADGARISQWSYSTQELQPRDGWSITALEVVPLVRRVFVDRQGTVRRIGLTLNLSHARLDDLRIKLIAPSGRAVEIETGRARSSSLEDIRIPAAQLSELIGESLSGTWSISVRDEALGVAGQLVGWNLNLNAQGAVEDFQRGLNIPDPAERETDDIWFDGSGRYAVARAMQSDSARIWDLAFAEPVRVIAVNENERLVGLDSGARHLVTATNESVTVWDTATGDRSATLPIGAPSDKVALTGGGAYLFVEHPGDIATRFELWSLETGRVMAALSVAGVASLVAVDPTGSRVAVADYDRAVRIWDFMSGDLLAQIDLPVQPSAVRLSAGGTSLGVVHGRSGVSLWNITRPRTPLVREFADGDWELEFSPSGNAAAAGRARSGYQVYSASDGRLIGPPIGIRNTASNGAMLAFSEDESVIVSGDPQGTMRFWSAPDFPPESAGAAEREHNMPQQAFADRVTTVLPGATAFVIGDADGHVHVARTGGGLAEAEPVDDELSYLGHTAAVVRLVSDVAGSYVASVADDNTVKVWDTSNGKPFAWTMRIEGDAISGLAFSPDASVLAVLTETALTLVDVNAGSIVQEFGLGEDHASLAFAAQDWLVVGSEGGILRQISKDADGSWSMSRVWQGPRPIRLLAGSQRGNYLIIVDDVGTASLFIPADGAIGDQTIDFPGPIEEVAFGRSGSRALVRTARWVHRVSLSVSGIHWIDSVLAPKPLRGAGIVFGSEGAANRAFLPAARNGSVELVEIGFPGSAGTALVGRRVDLLTQWRGRLEHSSTKPDSN